MKLLIFSALVLGAYGFEYKGDYVRLGIIGDVIGTAGNGTVVACVANHSRYFLVRPLPVYAAFDAKNGSARNLAGACIGFKVTTNVTDLFSTAADKSFALRATATAGTFKGSTNSAGGCTGTWVDEVTGFTFGGTSGTSACAGHIANAVNDGLITETGGNVGFTVQGTYHKGKRNLPLTLSGPFSNSVCTTLAPDQFNHFPLVVPMEASSSATANRTESAPTTTGGMCTQWKLSALANDAYSIIRSYVTATNGELVFEIGKGTGSTWTSLAACAVGTTSDYYKIKYTAGKRNDVPRCVQATNASDVVTPSKFFHLDIADEAVGDWPSFPADAVCPTCAPGCSPASGLQLSAFMGGLIAFIAMMM